ncbi:MAG: FKBP-type peptidyl-prolyl cis-trans isomerase [Longimicrobiaceae bacterium]
MRFRMGAAAAAVGALVACGDSATEGGCNDFDLTTVETRGDTVVTASGLRYLTVVEGDGQPVTSCDRVGAVTRGFVLGSDSAFVATAVIFRPGQGQVIRGLEEGVIGMRVNGQRTLIIPPELAFGDNEGTNAAGEVIIPANSTVRFEVVVQSVVAD